MKRFHISLIFILCAVLQLYAQNVPNGGFEDWEYNASNEFEPIGWQTNNMEDLTTVYQESGHSGQYSAKLSVMWDETLNMNLTPALYFEGNFPVSQRYTSLDFFMMGETIGENYVAVNVGMYKDGILIGNSMSGIYDDYFDWTKVSVPISYATADVPDECFISLTIWPAGDCELGSYFFIDDLELAMGSGPVEPILQAAITNSTGSAFELNFNTTMADPSGNHGQFSGTHNGSAVSFTSASLKNGNNATILLELASPVLAGEVLKVSYTAGTVTSEAGIALSSFTNQDVTNLVGGLQGSWQVIPSGVEENLYSVHFANSNVGYISGGVGRCLKSVNTGFNWAPLSIPSWAELFTVWATSDANIHIGAWDTIYNSTNGGQSWSGVYINTVNYFVMDMQFHSASLGYAFLQASAFKKTTDGGNSWSAMTGSGVIDDFLAGYMIDQTNGFAVGGAGLITHTTDGGVTWPQYDWNGWTEWSAIDIEGVYFTSMMDGFAVADSGVLFRTTNGGAHWSKSYIAGPEDRLKDIFFLNANLGWIVGYHGRIFTTTDGGNTWNLEAPVTSNDLNSVFFISNNLGWAVGNNGTILRFGEASNDAGETGSSFLNDVSIFPNPFTSSAAIEYTLPEKMNINIEIYDVSGRLIVSVHNGLQSAGLHRTGLYLPDLENGIYFFRITNATGWINKRFVICK